MSVVGHMGYGEAMAAYSRIRMERLEALKEWEEAILKASDAEAVYRKAYAIALVKSEGTAMMRDAQARAAVVAEEARRNVTRDMKDVCKERVRGLEGERANLSQLVQWSRNLDHSVGS